MATATVFSGKRGLHGVVNIGAVRTFSGKRGLHGVANVEAAPTFTGRRGLHGFVNIVDDRSPLDSIILFPPGASALASSGASALQLGSWLMADPGADYGAKGLIQSLESGNALTDGGQFGHRYAPVRRMAIPLILNSAPPASSPALWEGAIARAAHPGAMLAIIPEQSATRTMVFFDVIDGRWEPAYNTFHNRAGVRQGTLYLDTQPYGYWPTEILLASSASVGWVGALPVNGASVIGDVPPLAHVIIQPTSASVYPPTGSWYADMVAWSLAGNPSFQPLIPAANFVFTASPPPWGLGASGYIAASLSGDKYAPASQAWVLSPSLLQLTSVFRQMPWTQLFSSSQGAIPSALEPAYRGRFRVFAFARVTPSVYPWNMMVDAVPAGAAQALASANQIATMAQAALASSLPFVATGWAPDIITSGAWATSLIASPAYQILDCGELNLPPQGSGFQGPVELRVWAQQGPSGVDQITTNMNIYFGGLALLPVDGAAGILTGGLAYPSVNAWSATVAAGSNPDGNATYWAVYGASPASVIQGAFEMGARFTDSFLVTKPGATQALQDARALHRGVSPRIGASTSQLVLLTGDKRAGVPSQPAVNANFEFSQVSVSYRPLFQFLYGA